jgi:hypothetical protein
MKPGDFIEWTYKYGNKDLVSDNEELWSTLERRWAPIGLQSLLVWVTDEEYAWLTPKGLFHARRDDTKCARRSRGWRRVVPRTQG